MLHGADDSHDPMHYLLVENLIRLIEFPGGEKVTLAVLVRDDA